MMHKALIGFDINEYPEIEIFQNTLNAIFVNIMKTISLKIFQNIQF